MIRQKIQIPTSTDSDNEKHQDKQKARLLIFKASWCGNCKRQLQELSDADIDIPMTMIDISEHQLARPLVKAFGVTDVPTIVAVNSSSSMDDKSSWDNSFVKKWIDFTPAKELLH